MQIEYELVIFAIRITKEAHFIQKFDSNYIQKISGEFIPPMRQCMMGLCDANVGKFDDDIHLKDNQQCVDIREGKCRFYLLIFSGK